jgi:hypothetical protein
MAQERTLPTFNTATVQITKEEGLTTKNSILSIALVHNLGHEDERAIEKIITHPVWKLLVIPSMTQYNHVLHGSI